MAYLVMARKWRPRNFEEMVGQEHIARTLRNAIEGRRIAHAYLFTGTRGVGKTTSARILAKALNCEKGPTPTPCETCESCKAVSAGTSLDVLEIDGASNRGVNEIRELREQVKYAPMQGSYKVYIIDEVHMLTKEAFNALLKTLEEPPAHVVFLFATTESNKVPHTILSRVQRFDFKRISEAQIRGRLEFICKQEGITFETEALEAVARKADGSMRDALSLFDQVIAFSGSTLSLEDARRILGLPPDELFGALLDALVAHDAASCYALIEKVASEGIEWGEFLLGFGTHLRDLLFARQEGIGATALGFSENRFRDLRGTHAELRDGDLIRYGKLVSDLLGGLKTAAHPRLHVEMGLLRMASLDRIATLSQLLQGGLGGGEPALAAATAASPAKPAAPPSPSTVDTAHPAQEAAKKKSLTPEPPALSVPDFASPLPEVGTEAEAPPLPAHVNGAGTTDEEPRDPGDDLVLDSGVDLALDPELDAMSPSAMAEAAEPLRFESLGSMAQNWGLVLQEALSEPNLMTIHLGGSRLVVAPEPSEPGAEAACTLEVAHQVAYDFFTAKNDSRRKLQALIQSRLRRPESVTVSIALREGPESALPAATTVTPGLRRRLADEPIVQSLLQLFEGRIVTGG